mgnify:CR=1 FL=1
MSESPWFRLYPADYFAKTGRLTRSEHGAYLLLLLHYYSIGPLPNNDADLAALAKCSLKEWAGVKPRIWSYFREDHAVLRQDRCDIEIEHRNALIEQKKTAGSIGGKAKHALKHTPQHTPQHTGWRNPSKSEPESEYIPECDVPYTSHDQTEDEINSYLNDKTSASSKSGNGQWWKSNQGIEAKAAQLGIWPKPGEGWPQLKNRCFDEINQRKG